MYGNYKNKAFTLRINEEIMEKIKSIAEKNYRTTTKQIELILTEWLKMNEQKSQSGE